MVDGCGCGEVSPRSLGLCCVWVWDVLPTGSRVQEKGLQSDTQTFTSAQAVRDKALVSMDAS